MPPKIIPSVAPVRLAPFVLVLALGASGTGAQAPMTPRPLYLDTAQTAAARAHDLVGRMTLEEKARELEDWGEAIPRLGVPSYQTWNEALHGVARAGYATVFPQAIGMAATWDPALVERMGEVIATEGRAKYNEAQREDNHRLFYGLTYWSPNINIFRDPRWGRGQETYGEDPFLTGRMGSAFVEGVQGPDPLHPTAVATSKHFAVHSGPESTRHIADVNVSPHDLEDTYLPAFRATVTEGKVKSVMCAYNAVDGNAACANTMLLQDHLRDAWKFEGFVVSDCGAIVDVTQGHKNAPDITHAAAISLKAGTDLSCSTWAPGFNTLADAVHQNLATEAEVTQAAERLFTARMELGLFDPPGSRYNPAVPASEIASAAHRQMALHSAEESMVLLKNNGALPFKMAGPFRSIAVVGPTADLLASLEGNYNGLPLHPVSPLDGMVKQFGAAAVHYAQGSSLAESTPVLVPRTVFGAGLRTEYFGTPDLSGPPLASGTEPEIQDDWQDSFPVPQIRSHDYGVRWTGTFQAPEPGKYTLVVVGSDAFPYTPHETYKLSLDGEVLGQGDLIGKPERSASQTSVGTNPSAPPPMVSAKPARIELTLSDTKPHNFQFEYAHSGDRAGGAVTLNWEPPADVLLAEATAAARQSDVVVAFTGLSPKLEGEEMPVKIEGFAGGDRTSLDLPAPQVRLLEAVAATGKPVIVVNLSGSAVALRWANDHAAAVLQAWYPGVEGGTAIARTLAGTNNPGGRLPVTFYTGTADLPSFGDYSMRNRTYRYYTGKPLWGFGYGLSYSSFRYEPVKLSSATLAAGQPLTATVRVKNTGSLAGDEVVEAYVKAPMAEGPLRSLAGFERVHLAGGESREVTLTLSPRSLSTVDAAGARSVLPGSYHLSVGSAQPAETSAKVEADFTIQGSSPLPK